MVNRNLIKILDDRAQNALQPTDREIFAAAAKALKDQEILELGRVFGMDKAEEGITLEQTRNVLQSLHDWLITRSQTMMFRSYQGLMTEYAVALAKILARINK